jgi:hypothetical protein
MRIKTCTNTIQISKKSILIFYLSATKIKWDTFAYLGDWLKSSVIACHDDVVDYNWLLKAMD